MWSPLANCHRKCLPLFAELALPLQPTARCFGYRNGGDGKASGIKCWCINATWIEPDRLPGQRWGNDNDVEVGRLSRLSSQTCNAFPGQFSSCRRRREGKNLTGSMASHSNKVARLGLAHETTPAMFLAVFFIDTFHYRNFLTKMLSYRSSIFAWCRFYSDISCERCHWECEVFKKKVLANAPLSPIETLPAWQLTGPRSLHSNNTTGTVFLKVCDSHV